MTSQGQTCVNTPILDTLRLSVTDSGGVLRHLIRRAGWWPSSWCSQSWSLCSLRTSRSLLCGGRDAAFTFLRHLKIARNAVSLGGVESLACHPRTTTHSGMTQEELEQAHIGEGLVRVSVGIEDRRDLLADFEGAIEKI